MSNTRAEANPNFCWHLEDIFPSNEAWEAEFAAAKEKVAAFAAHAGKLGTSSDALYAALRDQSDASHSIERLYCYAHMRRDEDNGNTLYQGLTDRAMQLIVAAEAAGAYVVP